MALPLVIVLLVFCVALPTSKSLPVGVHAGGYRDGVPLSLGATDDDEVQVDDKDVFTIIPEMEQLLITLEVAASRLEKNQLNMDLLLDRIERILHGKNGGAFTGEPADQVQHQLEPTTPSEQVEINMHGQDKTGNEDEAAYTGSHESSLMTNATGVDTVPDHSDRDGIVTVKDLEVEQTKPSTYPVKGDQDGLGQQPQGPPYLHPTAQSQSHHQQALSHPPSTPPPPSQQAYSAKQSNQLQQQLQIAQQQHVVPLQQQVEQPQQREVGHELDELDEIIDLASGLAISHRAAIKRPVAIKPPAASRAFAMRPITWEARRHTRISPDLEDFDLNLIDRGGLPWLPIR